MQPDQQRELQKLLSDPRLTRVMAVFHDKLSKSTELKGRLTHVTRDESDALLDIIPRRVKEGGSIALKEIDRLLREETGFHCSLEAAVEMHLRQPIRRRKVERARELAALEQRRRGCFALVRDLGLPADPFARVVTWLNGDDRTIRRHLRRWGDDGVRHVRTVAMVFARLSGPTGETLYLSELAAHAAGGQHALDADKPAGRLLYQALAWTFPEAAAQAKPRTALWLTTLLTAAGIARDPVSSLVHAYGLDGRTTYLRTLRAAGHDRPLTLLTLRGISDDVLAWQSVAFVVENPNVYAMLIERLAKFGKAYHPTIICTTGVLNLADHALLDALVRNGAHLFYSGDFDKAGLDIAHSVLARHGHNASPWRLTPADYHAALQDDHPLDPGTLHRLRPYFPDLVNAMCAAARAGDQEKIIDALARDLHTFIIDGTTPPRRDRDVSGDRAMAARL